MQTKIIDPTASAYNYPLLLKRLLLSGGRYEPNREIVYRDSVRYDYATLKERICRLANVLVKAGVKPGDTVGVMEWDSHRYLECMFAIPMIGAIIHTVNIRLSPDQVLYTMNHADDTLVLINDEFLPIAEGIHDQLTTVTQYVLLSDNEQAAVPDKLPFMGEYEQLLAEADTHYDFPDFDENSVATTFYTTGTTGNPKGVYFSHRQLVLHSLVIAQALGTLSGHDLMKSSDVYMPITPMFHVHGWGVPYAATMLGAKQVYPGRYDPEMLLKLYMQEKVSFSHCVPTIMFMIVQAAKANNIKFNNWKVLIGGSALPKGLAVAAREVGIHLNGAYGMSETCPLLAVAYLNDELRELNAEDQLNYRIKTGVPSALVDLEVMDENGKLLPHDGKSVGEIVCRTPWLTQGYFKEPEKSEALWKGGWLHTGDMATIDEKGFVQICDRMKDIIKTGGEWISSLDLENLLSQHAAVAESAVVGIPDDRWGERPFAMLVLEDGESISDEVIKAHLQQYVDTGEINKWAIPDRIEFVEAIPKTSVGKIDKKKIRLDIQ